ncbi:MAG: low molecular weight protein-tyrosine-phosphatase [Saprospiraceae bacterium]|nr:low molecular weight protein-tyrosine-phosphatase [Saprospiraceae bacterium]
MKILMVCLGNICRSPMAEGILKHLAAEHDLDWTVDSAGTSRWHLGEPPDRRAIRTCQAHGIDISDQRARQFSPSDFAEYDLILTMDDSNYQDVLAKARTDAERERVRRLTDYSTNGDQTVPDPYFDGRFEDVYVLLREVCSDLIRAHT